MPNAWRAQFWQVSIFFIQIPVLTLETRLDEVRFHITKLLCTWCKGAVYNITSWFISFKHGFLFLHLGPHSNVIEDKTKYREASWMSLVGASLLLKDMHALCHASHTWFWRAIVNFTTIVSVDSGAYLLQIGWALVLCMFCLSMPGSITTHMTSH